MRSNAELESILQKLINQPEDEVVELKTAANTFDSRNLGQYFSALSNEANLKGQTEAWLIFGIDNKGTIVGTNYRNSTKSLQSLKEEIAQHTNNRITFLDIHALNAKQKRVIMFEIPPALRGIPTSFGGHWYGRDGEALVPLNIEELERIRNELEYDWSAQVIPHSSINDLEPLSVKLAREKFKEKHQGSPFYSDIDDWTDEFFLNKTRLAVNGNLTNAAILLLGLPESAKYLSPRIAEITWKLDTVDDKSYQHFGPPFFLTTTSILQKIRNPKVKLFPKNHLIPIELSKYETRVILEGLHNCIAHQDYNKRERIVVTERGDRLIFENAGSFYEGSPDDYVLGDRTPKRYRNPLLAKLMVELGMIDSMGYGIHTMFAEQRKRFFPLPDYALSTSDNVVLQVYGHVIDENYTLVLMEKQDLTLSLVISLDRIQKKLPVSASAVSELKKQGLVIGKGRNFFISEPIATATNKLASYLKNRGFDDDYYKKLIVEFIKKNKSATRRDINELVYSKLPDVLTESQKFNKISYLLKTLKIAQIIENQGSDTKPIWVKKDTES